jgi:hypothetical protein
MDNPTNTPEGKETWKQSPNETAFNPPAVELLGSKLGMKLNCASNRREVTDDTGEARVPSTLSE